MTNQMQESALENTAPTLNAMQPNSTAGTLPLHEKAVIEQEIDAAASRLMPGWNQPRLLPAQQANTPPI